MICGQSIFLNVARNWDTLPGNNIWAYEATFERSRRLLTLTTMKRAILPMSLAALAAIFTQTGCNQAVAQAAPPTDDREIELMVYADNFAMVQETRSVDLQQGRSQVGLTNVSKSLDQNSVMFTWPSAAGNEVVSSTYDLGTQQSDKLLQRFLGKEIELVFRGQNGRESERQKGILEVADPGNIVVRVGDKYVVNPVAEIEAPTDQGIVTIPQLTAEVDSKSAGKTPMGLGYLTTGMSWNADYTVTLPKGSAEMDMECWATVTNLTGTDYPNAKLKFVAGSPNRAVKYRDADEGARYQWGSRGGRSEDTSGYVASPRKKVNMGQVSVGELHAYPYEAKATIKQDQMNRVRMMSADKIKVKRDYSIALPESSYGYSGNPDQRLNATLAIKFENSKGVGLGSPLPGGAVRVYEPGEKGALAYVGAATIADTPKDAKVNLTLTNVFDIYATTKRTSEKRLNKRTVRRTFEVTLHNEKSQPSQVRLVQPFYGTYKITAETATSTKLSGNLRQWTVTTPAGGETKLKFTVDSAY